MQNTTTKNIHVRSSSLDSSSPMIIEGSSYPIQRQKRHIDYNHEVSPQFSRASNMTGKPPAPDPPPSPPALPAR